MDTADEYDKVYDKVNKEITIDYSKNSNDSLIIVILNICKFINYNEINSLVKDDKILSTLLQIYNNNDYSLINKNIDITKIPSWKDRVDINLLILLFKCENVKNNHFINSTIRERINIENWINKVNIEINELSKSTTYFKVLNYLKFNLQLLLLEYLKFENNNSLYLNLIFELFNTGHKNLLIDQKIYAFFIKSFLLEPYGYFKKSIIKTFIDSHQFELLNLLCDDTLLDYDKIRNEAIKLVSFSEDELSTVKLNIIQLNIIYISNVYKTIRFDKLFELLDISSNDEKDLIIDEILKLKLNGKLIVKINQVDEILYFPLNDTNLKSDLNEMFTTTLPQVLERDWDALMNN